MSDFRFSLLKAVSQICDPPYIGEIVEYLGQRNITDTSIVELLMRVSTEELETSAIAERFIDLPQSHSPFRQFPISLSLSLFIMFQTAPRLNETIFECTFLNNEEKLCKFEEIMTEEGLCFTFNMLNGDETYTKE